MLFFIFRLFAIMLFWCLWPWMMKQYNNKNTLVNFTPEQSQHWRWRITLWWLVLDILLIESFFLL